MRLGWILALLALPVAIFVAGDVALAGGLRALAVLGVLAAVLVAAAMQEARRLDATVEIAPQMRDPQPIWVPLAGLLVDVGGILLGFLFLLLLFGLLILFGGHYRGPGI